MTGRDRNTGVRDCILVVDDNPDSLRFLVDTLDAHLDVEKVEHLAAPVGRRRRCEACQHQDASALSAAISSSRSAKPGLPVSIT
jgi:hypothetical protein